MPTLLEFRTSIKERTRRPELTDAQLNEFTAFALQRISAELDAPEALSTVTWTQAAPTVPADFGRIVDITRPMSNGFFTLKPLSAIEAQKWSGSTGDSYGYYADEQGKLAVVPADASTHTIRYFAKALLSTPPVDGDTNWILDFYTDLLTYATAQEIFEYVQNVELAAYYDTKYTDAMNRHSEDANRNLYGPGITTQSLYDAQTGIPRSM
jgi:hypothetical protein